MSNKFVSFLEKAGEDLLKGIEFVEGFGATVVKIVPQGASAVATAISDLKRIEDIVVNVEAVDKALGTPGLTSEQKLIAATPAASQVIIDGLAFGRQIGDPDAAKAAIAKITSGVVDFLNALKPATTTLATQDAAKN